MAQVKQDTKAFSLKIDSLLYELLDQMAKDIEQPKSVIVETYLSRGVIDWYQKNNSESPSFSEYLKNKEKRII